MSGEANVILKRLENAYDDYARDYLRASEQKKGIAGIFAHWFSTTDATTAAPENQAFLDEVEKLTTELYSALKNDGESAKLASEAVNLMLSKRQSVSASRNAWYILVAESQMAKLLGYLSPESLRALEKRYREMTPKHDMLPNQAKLYKSILKAVEKQNHR